MSKVDEFPVCMISNGFYDAFCDYLKSYGIDYGEVKTVVLSKYNYRHNGWSGENLQEAVNKLKRTLTEDGWINPHVSATATHTSNGERITFSITVNRPFPKQNVDNVESVRSKLADLKIEQMDLDKKIQELVDSCPHTRKEWRLRPCGIYEEERCVGCDKWFRTNIYGHPRS
jgi:hypothetical protein